MRSLIAAGAALLMGCSVLVDLSSLSEDSGSGGSGAGGTGGYGSSVATTTVVPSSSMASTGTSSGATCGDGILDGGEECDDDNDIDSDLCSSQCERNKLVFVTSEAFTGDMDGLTGADQKCTQLAADAGLGGTFMAWLSDSTGSPSTRMSQSPRYYVLPTGVAVAAGWSDLTDGLLLHPIDATEYGELSYGASECEGGEVWTNTLPDGTPEDTDDCSNWGLANFATSSAGNVTYTDDSWTDSGCIGVPCSAAMPIYCIEQ